MKQRPILMSPPMVQALQREINPKTVTRRMKGLELINEMPNDWKFVGLDLSTNAYLFNRIAAPVQVDIKCPYGVAGDRLWIKETYYASGGWRQRYSEKKGRDEWCFVDITEGAGLSYRYADNPPAVIQAGRDINAAGWYKRPSLFMPRAASRLQEEITKIGCERLQEITEAEAIAEGIESFRPVPGDGEPATLYRNYETGRWTRNAIHSYQTLWESINGPGSWDKNPWVWPVTFKQI